MERIDDVAHRLRIALVWDSDNLGDADAIVVHDKCGVGYS